MGILDIMSRIVSILVGLATLAEKSKPYIKRFGKMTVPENASLARFWYAKQKDPSASVAASDGPSDDCLSNR